MIKKGVSGVAKTRNTIRQYPECSKEEKKAKILIIKSPFLKRISPAFLVPGLV